MNLDLFPIIRIALYFFNPLITLQLESAVAL